MKLIKNITTHVMSIKGYGAIQPDQTIEVDDQVAGCCSQCPDHWEVTELKITEVDADDFIAFSTETVAVDGDDNNEE